MKFVVSVLAHEKPEIVQDQIQNTLHFLPGSVIVLHLHTQFNWGGNPVDFALKDKVFVNPASVPTFWGNLHHAHHANFHYAQSLFDFDYFLLHSSSDLFVKSGAAEYIPTVDAGVSQVAPQPTWGAPMFAEGDPVFQKIARDAGADELWCSQVEGTFYRREVFKEMVSIIERHFDYRHTLPYVHEEIYYPTIANAMKINRGLPYLIREDKENLPSLDTGLVDLIRRGELPDHRIARWKLGRMVDAKIWEGKNIVAMRPIPRSIDHPIRKYVRSLMEAA